MDYRVCDIHENGSESLNLQNRIFLVVNRTIQHPFRSDISQMVIDSSRAAAAAAENNVAAILCTRTHSYLLPQS
eukprot:scaffold8099_cov79-Skeletonema_dohrnii-CCMP3373.AAC.3